MYHPEQIETLEKRLGFVWKDRSLLKQALTHTSYINEHKHLKLISNQRQEFLGDAVLELVTSEFLFNRFPNYPEGDLTKLRAAVVCEPTLQRVAQNLGLGNCLIMGRGELLSGGRERPSILADALEALIGAIYQDQGYQQAQGFILSWLEPEVQGFISGNPVGDYKTELQELVQREFEANLAYTILSEEGPDHSKMFTAGVSLKGCLVGQGTGKSKKIAEQLAAKEALAKLKHKKDFIVERSDGNG